MLPNKIRRLLALTLVLCMLTGAVCAEGTCIMLTEEMYLKALEYDSPDLGRLKSVLARALAGEDIVIGTIGGSITQGSSASVSANCYASRLRDWWKARFSGNVTLKNAGIGATDSYLGVHRVYKQLLRYKPDLVIIEFSVNDSASEFYKASYDSLVQTVLAEENMPAVMLVFMTMEDGTSAVVQHSAVGKKYRLPMISYRSAVLSGMREGRFAWQDISPDNIHPNDAGHALLADMIERYLEDVISRLGSITDTPAPFTFANAKYEGARILNSGNLTADTHSGYMLTNYSMLFPGDWQGGKAGSRLVFTLEDCRNVGILYQKLASSPGGSADIYVDGVKAATLDADFSGGWGDYVRGEEVFSSNESGTHTLEILPTPGRENTFIVLGLMIS